MHVYAAGYQVDGNQVDPQQSHACMCLPQGTKWTATKWIHNKPYGGDFDALKQAASCSDTADDCA
jgi:prolyl 4-hydroxylase